MKKSILNLEGVEVLSKNEMKATKGSGGCAWRHSSGFIMHDISRAEVDHYRATMGGGRWCCSSCGSASWL